MFKELIFAFNVCRYVKSNAIVLTTHTKTLVLLDLVNILDM